MTTTISQVVSTNRIVTAEFVKLTLAKSTNPVTYEIMTYSNSFREETVDGTLFKPLGGLLQVGSHRRDIESTGYDMTVSLSGVEKQNLYAVLSSEYIIKGSTIEIYRAFYDDEFNIIGSAVKRYTGIITNYNVEESYGDRNDTYTISVVCSNFKTVLEKKVTGRFTNNQSWKTLGLSRDTSMKNVASMALQQFDFGKKK
jgi:hypothetical protein